MRLLAFLFICPLFAQCPAPEPCVFLPHSQIEEGVKQDQWYGKVDFLYWEGTEQGLEYASKNAGSSLNQNIQIYKPSFRYTPAFRLGLGAYLPHDDWALELDYTRYYAHTSDTAKHPFVGNSGGGIRSVWTAATAFQDNNFQVLWERAQSNWNLHANFFDLFLKHKLFLTATISFEPTFGVKLALLQQRYQVMYQSGNSASVVVGRGAIQFLRSSIAMKNRSLNLGLSSSLTTHWNLSDHFLLFGKISGSLLASRFSIGRNESDFYDNGIVLLDTFREGQTLWTLRPEGGALLGLGWQGWACKPSYTLFYGFGASYEMDLYWKQNMLFRFIDQTNGAMIAPTQGSLFFQGLTCNAFIDF